MVKEALIWESLDFLFFQASLPICTESVQYAIDTCAVRAFLDFDA